MSLAPLDSVGQEREQRVRTWRQLGNLADQDIGLDRRAAMQAVGEDIDALSVAAEQLLRLLARFR